MLCGPFDAQESGNETFEELQQLFVEMFQSDLGSGFGRSGTHGSNGHDRASSSSMSPPGPTSSSSNGGSSGNKRDSSAMSSGKARTDGFNPSSNAFCFGVSHGFEPDLFYLHNLSASAYAFYL